MTISRPYKRLCRPFQDNSYCGSIYEAYFLDPRYAADAEDYIRAYRLLERNLLDTFDYVEPCFENRAVYSHRFFQILLQACTEFEANAKVILLANGYAKDGNFNITDYWMLEKACRLSDYIVTIPIWKGPYTTFSPFEEWQNTSAYTPLTWYKAYNEVKHNRSTFFHSATLYNVLNAVSAVFVILFAQFYIRTFDPFHIVTMIQVGSQGELSHPNSHLNTKLPVWPQSERYDFQWNNLKNEQDPFQNYPFPPNT